MEMETNEALNKKIEEKLIRELMQLGYYGQDGKVSTAQTKILKGANQRRKTGGNSCR